jgi:hypothetical protein
MRAAYAGLVVGLAGCGSILGIEDLRPPTIHGAVRDLKADTVADAMVTLFRDPDATHTNPQRIGDAMTDSAGAFTLPISDELPLDGFFELADPRFVHTFSHLVLPVVDRADPQAVQILTLTPDGLRMVAADAGRAQDAAHSLVIAQVVDAEGNPQVGATISDQPGPVCYSLEGVALPCHVGATTTDGLAWLFDVPEAALLTITAVDAGGKPYSASFPVLAGPGIVFTPVLPEP